MFGGILGARAGVTSVLCGGGNDCPAPLIVGIGFSLELAGIRTDPSTAGVTATPKIRDAFSRG